MQHLNDEQLLSHYYHEADAPPAAADHLRHCARCSAQYQSLCAVLALVSEAPIPDRGEGYGEQVWNRLRWRMGSERRRARAWGTAAAIAAMLAVGFLAGLLWRSPQTPSPASPIATAAPASEGVKADPDRVLLVVVGDHLQSSERVLVELVNAGQDRASSQSDRAYDLLSANRLYRQTAAQRGDDRMAELLAELEPILIELSHAGETLEPKKLAAIQRRIDSKQLLFKVRVAAARSSMPATLNPSESENL